MGQNFPGLTTGGAAWFTDLTAADPTYIFPVITSLSFLVRITSTPTLTMVILTHHVVSVDD